MNRHTATRPLVLALVSVLAACAGPQAHTEGNALIDQGQYELGLAKLEQAAREQPSNAQYRIDLLRRRTELVTALNVRSGQVRQQGNAAEAERLSQQVLALEPDNAVALQSVAALQQDRRHRQAVMESEAGYARGGAAHAAAVLEQLRAVLQENPNRRDALALKNRIDEELGRSRPGAGRLAAAYRKPITLQFRDAPLRAVFDLIGQVAGLNFVFDREVDPGLRATIAVRDTSIEETIGMLLSANGLEQAVTNEKSVLVYPNTPQKVKDFQQLVVRSFFLANADVKTVSYSIKTLLKAKDIVTDDRLGIIMMRDTPEMVRMAERIIAMQDLADPEVMLEVEVLEVKRTRLMELGVSWPDHATLTLANAAGALQPLTLRDLSGITRERINLGLGSMTVNANRTNSDSNILANPRIRVRNKDKAKVLIGDRVPVITVTTNNGVSSDSVNYVDVGLKLDVEPNIYLDDEVAIKVSLEVSNVVKEVISKSGTQAYQIGTRSASTVLRLKDGETQVLAGLISDEDRKSANKVPGIGELPILNRLFGSQKDDSSRSEIVLSITPHVLRSVRRPDLLTAQFESGTESFIGGRGALASVAAAAPEQQAAPLPAVAVSPMTGGDDSAATAEAPAAAKGPGVPAPRKVLQ